jgi:hypothetical protein
VAIMAMGPGYHRTSQQRLQGRTQETGADIRVITSAGALVDSLHHMGIGKIALVAPYMKPLTQTVVDYIEAEGITVVDHVALKFPTTSTLRATIRRACPISWRGSTCRGRGHRPVGLRADAFAARDPLVEARFGKPVVTAAAATTFQMLRALDLDPVVPAPARCFRAHIEKGASMTSRYLGGFHVRANGIRQHVLRYGGRAARLLVPGITSPAITWGFVAEELAQATMSTSSTCAGGACRKRFTLDYGSMPAPAT